jgi:CRP-like cAMP-binding protein
MSSATSDEERLRRIRSVPLFAEVGEDSLANVLSLATEFEVAQGHILVRPGEPGSGLFIIEEGSARVELGDGEVELGEGDFFGDIALLTEAAVHVARVSASTPLRGLAIRRDDFDRMLDDEPRLAITMLRALAKRLALRTHVI